MRQFSQLPSFFCSFLLLAAAAFGGVAQDSDRTIQDPVLQELPVIPEGLRQAMLHHRHEEATELLEQLSGEEPEDGDLWLYLGALVQERAGETATALALLEQLEGEFPESIWIGKARFRRAELFAEQRQWDRAERIWESEAMRFRAEGRQHELAEVYFDIAVGLSAEDNPSEPVSGADFVRAATFYQRVLELDAPLADQDRARYHYAWCLEKANNAAAAINAYRAYLDEIGDPGKWVFEARFALGNLLVPAGSVADARREFENLYRDLDQALAGEGDFAARVAAADAELRAAWAELAGDAEFACAQSFAQDEEQSRRAIGALEDFLERRPLHPKATAAAFAIAERAYLRNWDEEALASFERFLERAPRPDANADERAEAERLRQRAWYQKGVILQRQNRHADAIAAFEQYVKRFPNGPDWAAAQRGMVDTEHAIGSWLRQQENWAGARRAMRDFLVRHPLDGREQSTMFAIGEMFVDEAGEFEPGEPERTAAFQAAIAEWRKLSEKYPTSDLASRALFAIGEVYENGLSELERAIEVYRACNFGPFASVAHRRLVVMTRPSLAIRTPRTWRSDEAAGLELDTRNVDSVLVQVYPLDLEAYFRKHLTIRRVEDLDLDLIAPEIEFNHEVEGAADYLPLHGSIELPVEGPGVWAVAVSAGNLRATTLVVRSDIDVIVKSSRREVFVFAEDMRQQEPAAGVSVLLALPGEDGAPEFHELSTGDDGVARLQLERLREVDGMRLLATRDGHQASDLLSLRGLGLAQGLSARGLVFTDRSAYRPGDSVRWRAVLRQVENGSYTTGEGEAVEWKVVDARGRTLLAGRFDLGSFGTVHGDFDLPATAPVGGYRLECRTPGDLLVSGSFTVAEYQLPRVQLRADTERDVIYRGEDARVEFQAEWAYGEPVANASLVVELPDGRRQTHKTGADGRVGLVFPTRDLDEEALLRFRARLGEEGAEAEIRVWVAAFGFRPSIELPRQVALAGETVPVTLSAVSAAGEPLARDLRLEVLRREARRGAWGETRVQSLDLATREEDGKVTTGVAIESGGQYLLRVFGRDRFGHDVVAEASLFVSGEDDEVKLRLLADRTEFDVGETLRATLHNRAGPGLALLTYEGEGILEHRIVRLGEGTNALALEVDHEHFPNFTVAAAMMRGNEFFTASAEFEVRRKLVIELEPEREIYAPGEQVYVGLRVTNQLGRPVAAEVSLGVVNDTLYDLYPDPTPPLRPWFETGTRRSSAMTTVASCTFSYVGVTRQVASAVLEEAERLALAAEEDKRRKEALDELYDRGAYFRSQEAPDDSAAFSKGGRAFAPATPPAPGELRELGYIAEEEEGWNQSVGLGGGAGGRGGGRGGRRRISQDPTGTPAQTAFWDPAIHTDAEGRARIRFEMPSISTRWRLTARGVGAGTLLGETRSEVISRADFFVELRAPSSLVEGDRPRFLARVHNLTGLEGRVELKLRLGDGGEATVIPAQAELGRDGFTEVAFPELEPVEVTEGMRLTLEATAEFDAGNVLRANDVRLVPVRPWGLEVADAASGVLEDGTAFELELPADADRFNTFALFVGHGLDRVLLEEALGRGPRVWGDWEPLRPASPVGQASELLGVATVLAQLQGAGRANAAEYPLLRSRAESLLAGLIAAQRADGGWPWAERSEVISAESTCEAMLALARARQSGFSIPPEVVRKGLARLEAAYQSAPSRSLELRAMLVHARAVFGEVVFTESNGLHRERHRLSPAGLAHLGLALVAMDRRPMAAEVAVLLADRLDAGRGCPVDGNLAWNRSQVEMTALALLALQAAAPEHAAVSAAAEYLLAHRPWPPSRARGWAVAALAEYQGRTAPSRDRLELSVRVGDATTRTFTLDAGQSGVDWSLDLPQGQRRVKVELKVRGRGQPVFAAVLRGFSEALDRRREERFQVTHHRILAPSPRFDGRLVRTGFSILNDSRGSWTNERSELELGGLVEMSVGFYRVYVNGEAAEDRDFLVLDIPLPAGARLMADSVRGNFESWDMRPGVLSLRLGQRSGHGVVSFELAGVVPGAYRMLPAVLRSAYEPQLMAWSDPAELKVLERGESASDAYRPTPDEMFDLGLKRYAAADLAGAWHDLSSLHTEFGDRLRADQQRQVAPVLLHLALEHGNSTDVVRFFELLKEKAPEQTVSFDRVLAVGRAYRELEEFERAAWIFREVVGQTFGKDLKVPGALAQDGQAAESLAVLDRLCREYPDLPSVVEAELALSDQFLVAAPTAFRDPSLSRAELDSVTLGLRGVGLLRLFLAIHADDPLAADAGLNLVSAFLALEDFATTSTLAGELAARFTVPEYADAFQYTRAVALWYLGQEDPALELLRGIASAEYPDGRGGVRPSPNRDLAWYILGQIHHARRDVEHALEYYERVAQQFGDAREALTDLREKSISLPEVTLARPGEKTQLDLEFRNVLSAEFLVYPVDLMTLYLREKDLSRVTEVNLAGIEPRLRRRLELGGGGDLIARQKQLELDLPEPGAYLVICRGDELFTSGLVLVSDLELRVREDAVAGSLRVQAWSSQDQSFQRGVDVRVVGSANGEFRSGETDPRGLFFADGVVGTATVIAKQEGNHYAFFRGSALLAMAEDRSGSGERPSGGGKAEFGRSESEDGYLQNVLDFNNDNQSQRQARFEQEVQTDRLGVQVKRVK